MKTSTYKEVTAKLGCYLKVHSWTNNSLAVFFEYGVIYCSYDAVIAILIYQDAYYYTKYHDYSKTTCLHATKMLNNFKKDRIEALNKGYAILISDYERP